MQDSKESRNPGRNSGFQEKCYALRILQLIEVLRNVDRGGYSWHCSFAMFDVEMH